MALDNFTGQDIQDTYQRVVQTEGGLFADGTGSTLDIITSNQTSSFITNSDTGSFLTNSDTSSFITNSDTGSFLTNSDTSSFITNSDTGSFLTTSPWSSAAISGAFNGVTSSFLTEMPTGVYSSSLQILSNITASGNISASGNIVGTDISASRDLKVVGDGTFGGNLSVDGGTIFGLNGFGITIDTISITSGSSQFGSSSLSTHGFTGSVDVSGSISANSFTGIFDGALSSSAQIATEISGAFNGITGSFITVIPSGTYSSSLQVLSNITASGDISSSGTLSISASLNSSTSLKTLMYDTGTGQIYHTGSYATGGAGTGFPFVGQAIITGSLIVSGNSDQDVEIYNDVLPGTSDEYGLGSSTKKWNSIFATNTFFGGIHEINLETIGIGQLQTGTVLVSKGGQMVPCDMHADSLVMGVVTSGSDYPIIMGAEPILVDGTVYEGDYIITSNRVGYGKAVAPDQIFKQGLFGKIIAQSLETNYTGGSIKAMIRKM